jgi:hypothetical protein
MVAEAVLARLTEPHRTVLVLRYMDDCSVGECAQLIGRTCTPPKRCWSGLDGRSNGNIRSIRKEARHD